MEWKYKVVENSTSRVSASKLYFSLIISIRPLKSHFSSYCVKYVRGDLKAEGVKISPGLHHSVCDQLKCSINCKQMNTYDVDHVRTTRTQNEPLISGWRQKRVEWAALFLLNATRTRSVFPASCVLPALCLTRGNVTDVKYDFKQAERADVPQPLPAGLRRRRVQSQENIWRSFDTSRRDLQLTWLHQRPADAAVQTNATGSYFEVSAPVKVEGARRLLVLLESKVKPNSYILNIYKSKDVTGSHISQYLNVP